MVDENDSNLEKWLTETMVVSSAGNLKIQYTFEWLFDWKIKIEGNWKHLSSHEQLAVVSHVKRLMDC